MGLVILDTAPLVKAYAQYDSIFSFYENGVKDVIALAAAHSGIRKREFTCDFDLEIYWMKGLIGQVLTEWENWIDAALEVSPEAVHFYQQRRLSVDRRIVIQIVREIEHDMDWLIQGTLRTNHYQVESPEHDEWLFGDDLTIDVNYAPQL